MSHPYHGLNELREMFLKFFETKGHLRLPSFSLVPQNDKSILLINAGMTPMKPWFKGEEEPPCRRVCTCQKCIRTGVHIHYKKKHPRMEPTSGKQTPASPLPQKSESHLQDCQYHHFRPDLLS